MSFDLGGRVPDHFSRLTDSEQEEYMALHAHVGSPDNRYNRNRRLVTLQSQFDSIMSYCIRDDGRDDVRCFVCGICWLGPEDIAINTRQLRVLLNKSKSSINGALAKMGYATLPTKDDQEQRLYEAMPQLRGQYAEQRQWTIRRRMPEGVRDQVGEIQSSILPYERPTGWELPAGDEDSEDPWVADVPSDYEFRDTWNTGMDVDLDYPTDVSKLYGYSDNWFSRELPFESDSYDGKVC